MEQQKEQQKRKILDPVQGFVSSMVESSKKPFEPARPNTCGDQNPQDIEALTKRIKDRLQKKF